MNCTDCGSAPAGPTGFCDTCGEPVTLEFPAGPAAAAGMPHAEPRVAPMPLPAPGRVSAVASVLSSGGAIRAFYANLPVPADPYDVSDTSDASLYELLSGFPAEPPPPVAYRRDDLARKAVLRFRTATSLLAAVVTAAILTGLVVNLH